MRIPPGISRIPLWKRDIPKYPLYYKGDPQNKIVLPLFWMKMIPAGEKIPPNYVHFVVHPQMSKLDIKQYLEKIYNVPVLNVRTQLKKRRIQAHVPKLTGISEQRQDVWTEEDKYAYVQLRDREFKYPDFFEEKTSRHREEDEALEAFKTMSDMTHKASTNQGLPTWFRHEVKPED